MTHTVDQFPPLKGRVRPVPPQSGLPTRSAGHIQLCARQLAASANFKSGLFGFLLEVFCPFLTKLADFGQPLRHNMSTSEVLVFAMPWQSLKLIRAKNLKQNASISIAYEPFPNRVILGPPPS